MLEIILPKNYINILAGMVSIVFEQLQNANLPAPTVTVSTIITDTEINEVVEETEAKPIIETTKTKTDDLTVINGIGPTFAKRLNAAGITTYQALANASPEHVKEVAKLADWQANPADWIAAAKELG